MSKFFVGLAWVCCLAVAGVLTAVITSGIVARDLAGRAEPAAAKVKPVVKPVAAVEVVQAPVESAEAASAVAAEDPNAAAAKLAADDPKAFWASLSEEEQKKLAKLLLNASMSDTRRRGKNRLRTDTILMNLRKSPLTEAQKQLIKDLRAKYNGRIDPAIEELFNRQEALQVKMQALLDLYGADRTDAQEAEIMALSNQLEQLMEEMRQAKAPLDAEFMAEVMPLLSPDQQQQVAAAAATYNAMDTGKVVHRAPPGMLIPSTTTPGK